MTTTAQSIIQEAQTTLIDVAGNRHPASELVRALNDMQRAIHAVRPDSTATSTALTLVQGVVQTLPATASCLIEITSLAASPYSAVRQARRERLDAVEPGWRALTATATIKHYMYDPRHPRRYEVYPPAIADTQLSAIVSAYPTDVSAPSGDGKAYTTVSGNISLGDEFKNALYHLIVYRAYLKGAEYANDPAMAELHLKMAVQDVGESLLARLQVKPGVTSDATAAEAPQ